MPKGRPKSYRLNDGSDSFEMIPEDVFKKLGGSSAHAISICRKLYEITEEIYPSAEDKYDFMFMLDTLNIYDNRICILYEYCHSNLKYMAGILLSFHIGIIVRHSINLWIDDDFVEINPKKVFEQVKCYCSQFCKEEK